MGIARKIYRSRSDRGPIERPAPAPKAPADRAIVVHEFFVPGVPLTAGSKRPVFAGWGARRRLRCVDSTGDRGKAWRAYVRYTAAQHFERQPLTGPIRLAIVFTMPRIQKHYTKKGTIRPDAPALHTCRPDLLKMARAVEDALTGIIWKDDAAIVDESLHKRYGETPGAMIRITEARP